MPRRPKDASRPRYKQNDVSYPRCGTTLPTGETGGIVGVNDGLATVGAKSTPCAWQYGFPQAWRMTAHSKRWTPPGARASLHMSSIAASRHWTLGAVREWFASRTFAKGVQP